MVNLSSADQAALAVLVAEQVTWNLVSEDYRDDDWLTVSAYLGSRINEIKAKEKKS